ncbi:MAG: class I SAM-dependent methyltransferase [Thermomicrobiales bacterium]
MEAYEPIAAYYDSEHDQFTDDIDWYLHLAQVAGPRVLELGCGSGRLLAPLAAAGARVVGVDTSAAMLQRAHTRLQGEIARGRVSLMHGDMQHLGELELGSFDLVILPLNGLLHLDEPAAQRRVLDEAARVLRPGGLLAADVLHAVPDALAAFDGRVVHEGTWEDGRCAVSKFSSRTVDWTNQLISAEVWYDEVGASGALSRHRTEFTMRWVTAAEFTLMLEAAGFDGWDLGGSYDGSPLTDMSDRMLVAARKYEDR